MKYLRLLLFPFSLLYGLVVIIRNWCYDAGLLKSHEFDVPVIVVGNLEVGGAGKSPMTEYLVRLLKADNKLAILSRGYGRDTKGYHLADTSSTATQVGDEPAQFKAKFPDVTIAVCEDRVNGINQLLNQHNLIILDDAFQHRAAKPGLSILLFDYSKIIQPHLLLPAGNWREPFSGRWRADIIIITKCPEGLTEHEQAELVALIGPLPYQQLYFTTIAYQDTQDMNGNAVDVMIDATTTLFLLTGIANAQPLLHHLQKFTPDITHHNYPDHHQFSLKNISKLADEFLACESQKKVIITTEKDAQRLKEQALLPLVSQLPILVLPIGVKFFNNSGDNFDQTVKKYVSEYRKHRPIH